LKIFRIYNNETDLINKAIKNNRKAQQYLYENYAPKMLSVCRYYIKDLQNAEATMLNGFLKVFTNLKHFKHQGSFEGWIRRIMVRESISFIRSQKQINFSIDEVNFGNITTTTITTELEVNEIQQLIDALPEGYKLVFIMYAIEGYKHQEIAEMLNISEGTSKSQLYKARKLLQQKVKELNKTSNVAY
jgi:RNA polymerase sigma-70 factor (ECF subfamily)